MKDLDELLREDARRWQTPSVAAPNLDAALARASARRAKLGTAAALVVVIALAAGGVTVADHLTSGVPATPDPRGTPSAPAPSPTPSSATGSLADLTDTVHENAIQFGIPAQVEAVRTTWLDAQEFLPAEGGQTAGDTSVWVVQVRGEFTCETCQTTKTGPDQTVSTLVLVLDAEDFERRWYELGDAARPLAGLGTVVELDPDGSAGYLSFTRAVHDNATEFGIPVTGEAVLTTWLDVAEFLPVGDDGPAGDTQVWLVELRGEFSCDDCDPAQSGPEQSVSVLTLVLDADGFERYYAEAGEVTRPLASLGVVQTVDLELVA